MDEQTRHKLQLYLLWSCVEEGHDGERDRLLTKLLAEDQWTPQEEYFLAYLMLRSHGKNVTQPERLETIKKLLLKSFKDLGNDEADSAFSELAEMYGAKRAPDWYWAMLESVPAVRPQSYWIPYKTGEGLADGNSYDQARRALSWLDRAKSNLSALKEEERPAQRAWIAWRQGAANNTLGRYTDDFQIRENAHREAVKVLRDLIKTLPENPKGWPPKSAVFFATR